MPARTAKKAKSKAGKGKAKEPIFISGLYSSRRAECELESGPQENQVSAKAEILVCDNEDDKKVDTVLVNWTLERSCFKITGPKPGQSTLTRAERACDGTSFKLDEVETWVSALYKAVQLAKSQGYLPSGKES